MDMKKQEKFVVTNDATVSYIDNGNLYKVIEETVYGFYIGTDAGNAFCIYEGCAHIGFNSWSVVDSNGKEIEQ